MKTTKNYTQPNEEQENDNIIIDYEAMIYDVKNDETFPLSTCNSIKEAKKEFKSWVEMMKEKRKNDKHCTDKSNLEGKYIFELEEATHYYDDELDKEKDCHRKTVYTKTITIK